MLETTPAIENLLDRLVAFIIKYRANKAFKGYTKEQIRTNLHAALLNMTMIYCTDEEDNITGIVHGRRDTYSKIFYVYDILAKPGCNYVLRKFIEAYKVMFPDYALIADRRDKKVEYNTKKLLRKILGKETYINN